MAYRTIVTGIGELAPEMAEQGLVIVFNENAPAELADLSILHTSAQLDRGVEPGDRVKFGGNAYTVTAGGEEANYTLGKMGHCTFCFDGTDQAELPGQIVLSGGGLPTVQVGDPFEIHFQ
ncbi:MAG: PTS glucitol/sorbitol transporter subunit IIA [Bacillota bacterium]